MGKDIVITAEDMLSDEELGVSQKNIDDLADEIQLSKRRSGEDGERCVLSVRIPIEMMDSILEFELAYRKKHRKKLYRTELVTKALESYLRREIKKLA